MAEEKKSIFDFADMYGYKSPWEYDWVQRDFEKNTFSKDEKQKVKGLYSL